MNLFALAALKIELSRWTRRGRAPVIWWRDDDARGPTPALDRLLALAGGLPLSLAVIPDGDLPGLARRLAGAANVAVSQHGVDHANRSLAGQGASEYRSGARKAEMIERIGHGRAAMAAAGLDPLFYTPPWNEIHPALPRALAAAGFERLSAYEGSAPTCELVRLDCCLDILRWRGGARFRGSGPALTRLTRLLAQRRRREDFQAPIGLLTHHLAHDEAAWAFLAWFLAFGRLHFDWRSFEQLTASQRGRATGLSSLPSGQYGRPRKETPHEQARCFRLV